MAVTINGSAGVTTNSGAVYNGLQTGTAVSVSGTSVNFTDIPSWVKRITVMFKNVSTNGTSLPQIQIGSSSVTTSGYTSTSTVTANTSASNSSTSGFVLTPTSQWAATSYLYGSMVLCLQESSSNTWVISGILGGINASSSQSSFMTTGYIALSGTLDRVRITTVNGTDTFDAGTINIIYE